MGAVYARKKQTNPTLSDFPPGSVFAPGRGRGTILSHEDTRQSSSLCIHCSQKCFNHIQLDVWSTARTLGSLVYVGKLFARTRQHHFLSSTWFEDLSYTGSFQRFSRRRQEKQRMHQQRIFWLVFALMSCCSISMDTTIPRDKQDRAEIPQGLEFRRAKYIKPAPLIYDRAC